MDIVGLVKEVTFPSVLIIIFYIIIKYPEKIQIWGSLLQRLYAWASKDSQKKVIANELEGKLNLYSRIINTELGSEKIMPYTAKIEWIEDKAKEIDHDTFVKEDHVVIKMTYHQNREKNIALGALNYVSKALIPKGRIYVDRKIMKSIDLTMVQKILSIGGFYSGMEYFLEDILPPWLQDELINSFYEKLQPIDDRGFFTTILLHELLILGKTIPLDSEQKRRKIAAETRDLILFLHDIATRTGEGKLAFLKSEIRIGIILIAKQERKESYGITPYLRRFNLNWEEGCERVYLFTRGQNIPFMKEIIRELEKRKGKEEKIVENKINVLTRKGKATKGYYALYRVLPW